MNIAEYLDKAATVFRRNWKPFAIGAAVGLIVGMGL